MFACPPSNLLHPDEHSNSYRPPAAAYGASHALPQPTTRPYIVSTIENTCYAHGMTVAAQQGDTDGTDYILCMAPDLTRIGSLGQLNLPQQQPSAQQQSYGAYTPPHATSRPSLTEYATLLAIPGRTWAMATVPRPVSLATPAGGAAPVAINELALQYGEPPHQFMLLTNVGLTFLTKRRALDYLKAVLEELQSEGNVQPIIEFRDRCEVYVHAPILIVHRPFIVSDGTRHVQCSWVLLVGILFWRVQMDLRLVPSAW